mmetsp:Transcript_11353/g.34115  ORF Transcript_11353/g.34115 Transcript_11353/m.34115 type:complete len:373 (-) Transcript_11353:479-1597(-)
MLFDLAEPPLWPLEAETDSSRTGPCSSRGRGWGHMRVHLGPHLLEGVQRLLDLLGGGGVGGVAAASQRLLDILCGGGVGGVAAAGQGGGAVQVLLGQLHALHVVLLVYQQITVLHEDVDVHRRPLELDSSLLTVHQALAQVLNADVLHEVAHLVIVHTRAHGTEEVDGLAGEGVHDVLDLTPIHTVVLEDTHAHTNAVLAGGVPVELLHATVTDERRVQGTEVVTRADDGHTGDLLSLVDTGQLHVGGGVGDVHEGGIDHLVVDSVLGSVTHATGTGIQIVDEQGAELALLDDVGRLAVALAHQLGGLTGVAGLQLTSGHHNGVDTQLLVRQCALEGLSLALATPDTQNQGHLDLGEVHEVLGHVDGHLVQE